MDNPMSVHDTIQISENHVREWDAIRRRFHFRITVTAILMAPITVPMALVVILRNVFLLLAWLTNLVADGFNLLNEAGGWLFHRTWIGPKLVRWCGPIPDRIEFIRSKLKAKPMRIKPLDGSP